MFEEGLAGKQQRKALIEQYPFLLPKSVVTGQVHKDFDYSFVHGEYDLPEGWFSLFLQCCSDIYKPLHDAGLLEKFGFLQIKEKWGRMTLYTHNATDEVLDIINKYTFLSEQVCSVCGAPATVMTSGYVCPYCEKCAQDIINDSEKITIKTSFSVTRSDPDGKCTTTIIDCSDEWNRYLRKVNQLNET